MKHLSLFTGVGGFDLGLERAGIQTVGQVEWDKDCQTVLKRHWPNTPRWEDIQDVRGTDLPAYDVLTGGFPCQDISVAGKRAGLAGERSGLWYEFARIIAETSPTWVVIENVPGLLSSNRGRDMGAILGTLGDNGYGFAWRVLDAQWFGVAQRRRRVFIVGHLGGDGASQILAVGQGSAGHPPPSRETRQVPPPPAGSNLAGYGNTNQANFVIPFTQNTRDEVRIIGAAEGAHDAGALAAQEGTKQRTYLAFNWQTGQGQYQPNEHTTGTLHVGQTPAVAYDAYNSQAHEEIVPTLGQNTGTATGRAGVVMPATTLRRLTPTECARLQGFPDNWNDHLSDTQRYRQYGNAVCVKVTEWIAHQLANLDN